MTEEQQYITKLIDEIEVILIRANSVKAVERSSVIHAVNATIGSAIRKMLPHTSAFPSSYSIDAARLGVNDLQPQLTLNRYTEFIIEEIYKGAAE